MEKLDDKAKLSWRIGRIIGFAMMIIMIFISFVIIKSFDFYKDIKVFLWIGYGLIVLYNIVAIIVYPLIEYNQWGYKITEDQIIIHHGIFFLETKVVPIVRVQHIEIGQGPINRKLGLAKVHIYVASGEHEIDGLNYDLAVEISEKLKKCIYQRLEESRL